MIDRDATIASLTEDSIRLTGIIKKKSIYLIPEFFEFENDYKRWMKENYRNIFEMEIQIVAIQNRPKKWIYSLFEKWFNVERVEFPDDMIAEPIYKEQSNNHTPQEY
jgi:hypothetical protein